MRFCHYSASSKCSQVVANCKADSNTMYRMREMSLTLLSSSMAQWLARSTRDPAVTDSIPNTAHVVIALGKQFTYISSVHASAKWVTGHRQLKCIDY